MIVVSNSGPLIALAKIGQLNLLSALYGEIIVPQAVYEEVLEEGRGRPGSKEAQKVKWIKMAQVQDRTAVQVLRSGLGTGESEAIILAMELKADLVLIDEKRAARIAQSMGLVKAGTVGTLIAAKRAGLIPAVMPLLDRLLVAGVRISQELYRYAQELADEGAKNETPRGSD